MRERLATAQELLETTDLTVASVAGRVGLGSAANFRARFHAAFGTGPAEYRRTWLRPDEPCTSVPPITAVALRDRDEEHG